NLILRIFPNKDDSNPIMPQSRYVPGTVLTSAESCIQGASHIISEATMSSVLKQFPRVAIFLAGVAAGAITLQKRKTGMDPIALDELKQSLAGLDSRLQAKEAADEARFSQVEARLEEHATRLADVPSTSQIVAA